MLESFKRLFSPAASGPDWRDVADWARERGLAFKRAREDEGFVVEGELSGRPVRIEWGPPQRAYIEGRELRIRMELKLPADLQMLLLSRPLMELLEKQTFERFTEGMIAGYQDLANFWDYIQRYEYLLVTGQFSCPGIYVAMHELADGYPDPKSGECTALSAASPSR